VGDVVNFTGEVCFKSMLRIDGHFSGNVISTDGTLIVSTGAQVTKAVIKVAVAKINGTVEGDILASKQLILGRTANVRGHLAAPALVVEEGAQLNGSCRRIEDTETLDFNTQRKASNNREGRGSRPSTSR
jgi:cytoskeletal protein CcmA (bactofilin family)